MIEDDPMIEGYLDGRAATEDEFPERLSNRGHAYRHGWLNGRDDRTGKPRACPSNLREAGEIAIALDRMPFA